MVTFLKQLNSDDSERVTLVVHVQLMSLFGAASTCYNPDLFCNYHRFLAGFGDGFANC